MEKVIENQNLAIDIGHDILDFLDDKSLMSCRFVNSALKNMVDNPKYWIKKLAKKGIAQEHLMNWIKLADLVENSNPNEELLVCLIKMNKNFSDWGQPPIHAASKIGASSLVQMILKHIDYSVGPNQLGNTPMMLAATRGHLEVMKLLISSTDQPNVPDKYGETPLHAAALKGYFDVVKLLIPVTDNPNVAQIDGFTPIFFAAY